jgi:hypothetical protein
MSAHLAGNYSGAVVSPQGLAALSSFPWVNAVHLVLVLLDFI